MTFTDILQMHFIKRKQKHAKKKKRSGMQAKVVNRGIYKYISKAGDLLVVQPAET